MKPHFKPLSNSLQTSWRKAIILHFTFSILNSAIASVPLSWQVTPRNPAPVTFDRHHGETLEFRCAFSGFGELPFAQAADIRLWYQTNGMAAAWWSVPASVSSNVLSATFPPQADPGADRLSLFFGAPSNAYASAVLRLRHSPGFAPNVLPPPDMSSWATELDLLRSLIDYSTSNATLVATIEATAPAPGDYETVSNRAMSAVQLDQLDEALQSITVPYASEAYHAESATDATYASNIGVRDVRNKDAIEVILELDAAAKTNAAQTAAISAISNNIPAMAAAAVYDVHDLMWDETESILYWHKIRQGHDEYIAVTNIDLTHPTNAVILKAWREANR